MALVYEFILDTFQDRRIGCFRIDGRLTRCPLEHQDHLDIIYAPTVFIDEYSYKTQ